MISLLLELHTLNFKTLQNQGEAKRQKPGMVKDVLPNELIEMGGGKHHLI